MLDFLQCKLFGIKKKIQSSEKLDFSFKNLVKFGYTGSRGEAAPRPVSGSGGGPADARAGEHLRLR